MSAGPASAPVRAGAFAPIQLLAVMLLVQGVPVLGLAVLEWLGVDAGRDDLDGAAWGMLLFTVGCACAVVFAAATPRPVSWRPVCAGATLRSYLLVVVPWLVGTVGYLRLLHALGRPVAMQSGLEHVIALGAFDLRIVPFALGVVVLAPLAEEIVFRGYLLGALQWALSPRLANAVAALLFGLVHGLDYALPLAALGWFFGALRQRHGALWPAVLAHMLHNGLTFAVALWAPWLFDWMYPR